MPDAPPVPAPPPLLAAFKGARPTAPAWFDAAIAKAPTRRTVAVEGADIELLTWGRPGAPGLLLAHGGMAHADWWSFIAPFFAETHRVVALSWSGMGASSWRATYSIDQYVREMRAALAAADVAQAGPKPIILAHSFGGFPTMRAARTIGRDLGGVMILDAPVLSPEQRAKRATRRASNEKPPRDTVVYADAATALARFRFAPPQPCEHLYIVDWIARQSLRAVPGGVTWKFDPFLWSRLERSEGTEDLAGAACPVAMIWGARSSLFPPETIAYIKTVAPAGTAFIEIPDAAHHVMADQPLALVATMRTLLASGFGRA